MDSNILFFILSMLCAILGIKNAIKKLRNRKERNNKDYLEKSIKNLYRLREWEFIISLILLGVGGSIFFFLTIFVW